MRADEVRVGDGALVVGRAGRDHLAARPGHAGAERRRREVQDELGARVAAAAHRPVGRPDVLADLSGEACRSRTRRRGRRAARRTRRRGREPGDSRAEKVRALVEDVVGGELLLRARDPRTCARGGRARQQLKSVAADADGRAPSANTVGERARGSRAKRLELAPLASRRTRATGRGPRAGSRPTTCSGNAATVTPSAPRPGEREQWSGWRRRRRWCDVRECKRGSGARLEDYAPR